MGIKHRVDSIIELRERASPEKNKAAVEELSGASELQSRFILAGMGVDVEITPEDTGRFSEIADLPPLPDMQDWRAGLNLVEGTIVVFGGKNYQVTQSHISLAGWPPDLAPALFRQIQEDYAEWSQPLGAHDAYAAGDRVSHNGKKWVSDLGGNIWEPGVFGWSEVT